MRFCAHLDEERYCAIAFPLSLHINLYAQTSYSTIGGTRNNILGMLNVKRVGGFNLSGMVWIWIRYPGLRYTVKVA